jgi:hypothetical protein
MSGEWFISSLKFLDFFFPKTGGTRHAKSSFLEDTEKKGVISFSHHDCHGGGNLGCDAYHLYFSDSGSETTSMGKVFGEKCQGHYFNGKGWGLMDRTPSPKELRELLDRVVQNTGIA